jgi:hypothetical protein
MSVPDLKKDPVQPVSEMLNYNVPASLAGYSFHEFHVIYSRLNGRTDKSSKVSIEQFVLIPKGLN